MPTNGENLILMAQSELGEVTPPEEKLVRAAANGEVAEYIVGSEEERTLRANLIRWLCAKPKTRDLLTDNGIRIRGAKIEGELCLDYQVVEAPLIFRESVITAPIRLRYAKLSTLEFEGTHIKTLDAEGAKITGSALFNNAFLAEGKVSLYETTIDGNLECSGGQFFNGGGDALQATGVKVGGSVLLNQNFWAIGSVRLYAAVIGGNVECEDGHFSHGQQVAGSLQKGIALDLELAKITGSIFLGKGFTAEGTVRLYQATIAGDLDCGGGQFLNEGGDALQATGVKVGAAVSLNNDFLAAGKVSLYEATIGSDLDCRGGQFLNEGGDALQATGVKLSGAVLLLKKFVAKGKVNFYASIIGGSVECNDGSFLNRSEVALSFALAKITGLVRLTGGFRAKGNVRLYETTIGGDLDCGGGQFLNEGGDALEATGVKVGAAVSLNNDFLAAGKVRLYQATIGSDLDCRGGQFLNEGGDALQATGVKVGGSVLLNQNFWAIGSVRLYAAVIGGNVECEDGHFSHGQQVAGSLQKGIALDLELAKITGSIFLGKGFTAQGTVRLYETTIGSNLVCGGGQFLNEGGDALQATGVKVGGSVPLNQNFWAIGSVRLYAAVIGGNVECEDGHFSHGQQVAGSLQKGIALDLELAKITGSIFLGKGFTAQGTVRLYETTIGSNLVCGAGQFLNEGGDALQATGVNVSGSVYLNNQFLATGRVDFFAAKIGGDFDGGTGCLLNPQEFALNLDVAKITGAVFLTNEFTAEGAVSLYEATLGGNLVCGGGQFLNEGGMALEATAVRVDGAVLLDKKFTAKGGVNLDAATININLQCDGGCFLNRQKTAFTVAGARIGGDVIFGEKFHAEGKVTIEGIRVGGALDCKGSEFINTRGDALVADGADIAGNASFCDQFLAHGALSLVGLKVGATWSMFNIADARMITKLDLRFADVTTLEHAHDSWPEPGCLRLNGLVYKALGEKFPVKLGIEWLQRQQQQQDVKEANVFAQSPYERLANVLKSSGHEPEAKRVLIAKQDDLRRYGSLTSWGKGWNWLLGVTIKHGYQPHRALFGMLFFVLLGTGIFQVGYWNHLITPSNEVKNERKAKLNYPKFQAFVYSLDTFVPIIDLKQKGYWLPNPNMGRAIVKYPVMFRRGGLLRIYFWIHIIFGWVLTTLWVAGFTGLVRKLS